jgi:IclR family transcriptional regulator, KDG regulon repressor
VAQSVRAVERAMEILSCFTRDNPALTLTEIAELVRISKSTVHRLLATLEGRRFITRDRSTGIYRLGFQFIEMASLVDMDLQHWSLPYLQHLSTSCGETVDLAVLDGASMIYLQVIESQQRVKLAVAIGQRLPAYCTASGKAFLAFLPTEQVNTILRGEFLKYTERTPTSLAAVHEALRAARAQGFAISEQEYEQDINAVAAPILSQAQHPIAVVAVAGPSYRLTSDRMLDLGQTLRGVTEAIAREVGVAAITSTIIKKRASGSAGIAKQGG